MGIAYWKEKSGKMAKNHEGHAVKCVIVTCMSPYIDPVDIFDLESGEAYVIRSGGNLVTAETIRCIILAMMNDPITDVIVLGHTRCTNANQSILDKNHAKLLEKIPHQSKLSELLATREKATKYFGIFKNEIDNVLVQVCNLSILKIIKPGVNITGMLYNTASGLVYDMAEITELKAKIDKNPGMHIEEFVPSRYTDFLNSQGVPASEPSPARPPVGNADVPMALEPMEGQEDLQGKMQAAGDGFDLMMKAMQKTITKAGQARVSIPKIRLPGIRAPRPPRALPETQ